MFEPFLQFMLTPLDIMRNQFGLRSLKNVSLMPDKIAYANWFVSSNFSGYLRFLKGRYQQALA